MAQPPPYTVRCRRQGCDAFLGRFATEHAADQARRHHVHRWHPIEPEAGAYYRETSAGVPRWQSKCQKCKATVKLGTFGTSAEAHAAYRTHLAQHHEPVTTTEEAAELRARDEEAATLRLQRAREFISTIVPDASTELNGGGVAAAPAGEAQRVEVAVQRVVPQRVEVAAAAATQRALARGGG